MTERPRGDLEELLDQESLGSSRPFAGGGRVCS
jgi:hypothetical protein